MTSRTIDEGCPLIVVPSLIPSKTDNRTGFQKRVAIWTILLCVTFERLAFYGLAGNLILFLTSSHINWTSFNSITASFIFFGTSYISSLLFSWFSDAKIGRAKTIIIGFIIYLIGYILILLFSKSEIYEVFCNGFSSKTNESTAYYREKCSGAITAILTITGIGVGAVQANMVILGAEQILDEMSTRLYFDQYYVAVNTGCLMAYCAVAYIQQNMSYFLGYLTSIISLSFTIIIFGCGYKFYVYPKPHDSLVTNFFPVFFNALKTWIGHQRRSRNSNKQTFKSYLSEDADQTSFLQNQKKLTFFDYAKVENNGRFQDRVVNEIKSLRRIILLFFILLPYWLIYVQNETTFIVQGVHMKVPQFRTDKIHMPLLWLSLSDQVLIIFIILMRNICIRKRFHVKKQWVSIRSRIILGMIGAICSMCLAGTVEIFRQNKCDSTSSQMIGNTTYIAADMSIFYQLPQYLTMSLSEVFASIASLEFAYLAAPQSAQSLVMSLRFCSVGLASFLSSAYIRIYGDVYQDFTVINAECRPKEKPELAHIYYFVLAFIQSIFIIIFIGCDRKLNILKNSNDRFTQSVFVRARSKSSDI